MPIEIIEGEVTLNIYNSKNFLTVPNKPYLYVKVKRVSYSDAGVKVK
jgi:hypothetical protein